MIRLAVVEDDPLYTKQLQDYLDRYTAETGQKISARFFSDGEDIVESYQADFDIILMDIQMRFMDGMTAAQLIREKDENVIIMFLTNMTSYAIKGYEVNAMDYIVKPIAYQNFAPKLTRAMRKVSQQTGYTFVVPVQDGVRKVAAEQIYYIESENHTMTYHTVAGVFQARGSLDELEQNLSPYGFFRSNKCYLVNMNRVDGVEDGCCLIAGRRLLISRRKRTAFMNQLSKIL